MMLDTGSVSQSIMIILQGSADILLQVGEEVVVLDSLGRGSTLNQYTCIMQETCPYSARAASSKGNLVYILPFKNIQQLRFIKPHLESNLEFSEDFIENNGYPQIDYQIFWDRGVSNI